MQPTQLHIASTADAGGALGESLRPYRMNIYILLHVMLGAQPAPWRAANTVARICAQPSHLGHQESPLDHIKGIYIHIYIYIYFCMWCDVWCTASPAARSQHMTNISGSQCVHPIEEISHVCPYLLEFVSNLIHCRVILHRERQE